jgi:UrcA family protein
MNTDTHWLPLLSGLHTAAGTAILMALFAVVPVATSADQSVASTPDTRIATVSLVDLDLSTPEGMRAARDRLDTMARRVCAKLVPEGSHQPTFVACVDDTLAGALRQVNVSERKTVTRAAKVSLADLDLSRPEGMRTARDRLHAIAQRLCAELARSHELAYRPNFAACVADTREAALRRVDALATAKESRTARSTSP